MNLDGIIEDYPNTTTPLSKAVLTNLANAILGVAFPIGKIEMFYDAEDHSNYMGFTWELTLVGKMPIGINVNDNDFNQIGKSSGEKAHVLKTSELPKIIGQAKIYDSSTPAKPEQTDTLTTQWSSNWRTGLYNVKNESGGNSHNNMPPYEVVAFWKRVE